MPLRPGAWCPRLRLIAAALVACGGKARVGGRPPEVLPGQEGDTVRTLDVRATPHGLLARARAVGQLSLEITAPSASPLKPKRRASR